MGAMNDEMRMAKSTRHHLSATTRRATRISISWSQLFVALATIGLVSPNARAAEWATLLGADGRNRDATVSYVSEPVWIPDLGAGRLDVHWEVDAGRATALGSGPNAELWHVAFVPKARFRLWEQTAVELGIGPSVFSATRLGDKRISTAFQFADIVNVIHDIAGTRWTIGLGFSHYSNAGIKRPNSGQDYVQLIIRHRGDWK